MSIAVVAIALATFPALFADTNYDTGARVRRMSAREIFSRNGPNIALVRTGAPIPLRCSNPLLNREEWQYGTDEQTARDLLLFLPVGTTRHISNLHIKVAGENGLEVAENPRYWRRPSGTWKRVLIRMTPVRWTPAGAAS